MREGLPEGLFSTSAGVRGNIEKTDKVDVEDIARLWKVYHSHRAVFAENVGQRLEYFFWRVWSNDRLLDSMTGPLVAAIFSKISEGGYIRTTPTQSPRSSRSLGTFYPSLQSRLEQASSLPEVGLSTSDLRDSPPNGDAIDEDETETEADPLGKKKLPLRPPPIAKKSKSVTMAEIPEDLDQGPVVRKYSDRIKARTTSKVTSTRFATSPHEITHHGTDDRDRVTLQTDTAVKISQDEPAHTSRKSKSKLGGRKVAVVANTAGNKRRPVVRQKSSQSSSSKGSLPSSPTSHPGLTRHGSVLDGSAMEALATPDHSTTSLKAKRPLHQIKRAFEEEDTGENKEKTGQAAVFDEDSQPELTSKSASRTIPSHRSLISLPSILKKPSAAAAMAASYQAAGTMDLGQQSSIGSALVPDGTSVGNESPPSESRHKKDILPKTKSHLTLLLQQDRKAGAER
ncbi:MAG: hypothetical protein Q9220_000288 [cf. Caloplaca sp. 1 TL-2023]